jgi:hypothetical protein
VPDSQDADREQEETTEDLGPKKTPAEKSKPKHHRGWFRRSLAWLWNLRTLAGLVIGSVLGFVVGLVAFVPPWRLQPAWGDIPTWLLAFLGLIAGVVGLAQLGMLQDQGKEEHDLNVRRHELFEKQIEEADRRKNQEERRQAESVELRFRTRDNRMFPVVVNNSNRPILHISCRYLADADGRTSEEAEEYAIVATESLDQAGASMVMTVPKPGKECAKLPPGGPADSSSERISGSPRLRVHRCLSPGSPTRLEIGGT